MSAQGTSLNRRITYSQGSRAQDCRNRSDLHRRETDDLHQEDINRHREFAVVLIVV